MTQTRAETFVAFPLVAASEAELKQFVVDVMGLPAPTWPLHVTTVYSKVPVEYDAPLSGDDRPRTDWETVPSDYWFQFLKGRPDLGLCLTMHVYAPILLESHERAKALGATWDYETFIPHVTLAYDLTLPALEGIRLATPPYRLYFGPEIVRRADPNWKPS